MKMNPSPEARETLREKRMRIEYERSAFRRHLWWIVVGFALVVGSNIFEGWLEKKATQHMQTKK